MVQWPVKLTERGEICIPPELQKQLGIAPGDSIVLRAMENGAWASLEVTVADDPAREENIEARERYKMRVRRQAQEDARRLPPITMTSEKAFGAVQSPDRLSVEEAEAVAKDEYVAHLTEEMRRSCGFSMRTSP